MTLLCILIVLAMNLSSTELSAEPAYLYPNALHAAAPQPSSHLIYNAKHLNASELSQVVTQAYPNIQTTPHNKQNKLLLIGEKADLSRAKKLLEQYDTPYDLLTFEVKIVEISFTSLSEYDAIFSQLGSGLTSNLDPKTHTLQVPDNLTLSLQALENSGQAKVLAQPVINVLNHHTVTLQIGDQLPYVTSTSQGNIQTQTTQQINTGIQLTLAPKKTEKSTLYTDIDLSVSNVKIWKEIGQIQYPILATRHIQTSVIFKDTTPLLITGLTQSLTRKNQSEIPFLRRIPLIKYLFLKKNHEKTTSDILIHIIPQNTIRKNKKSPL